MQEMGSSKGLPPCMGGWSRTWSRSVFNLVLQEPGAKKGSLGCPWWVTHLGTPQPCGI